MLAMYARSKPTEILRPMAEEMVRAIITAFKDEVQENKWMDKAFKKVWHFEIKCTGTVRKSSIRLLYLHNKESDHGDGVTNRRFHDLEPNIGLSLLKRSRSSILLGLRN
ncbi:hypothetical protein GCK32_021536 [Trichostrongylus colubriformis]|uniref:Uncharacterized protein n=1 Tax=Trichostrongylus colubriformis TaxID=6319 RepID=A0AAN8IND5_TRICO